MEKELAYYKKRIDQLAADLLRMQYTIAHLTNEVSQLRSSFRMLADVSDEYYQIQNLDSLLEEVTEFILRNLGFDRVLLLEPTGSAHAFRIKLNIGKQRAADIKVEPDTELNLNTDELVRSGAVFHNSSSVSNSFSEELQRYFGLPYYVAAVMKDEKKVKYILIAGRLNENKSLKYMPVSATDKFIFDSVSSMLMKIGQQISIRNYIEHERNRIARDMHDNIGSELSRISLNYELLIRENPELLKHSYTGKIRNAINETSENLRNTVWLLNPAQNTLDSFVAYIREYTFNLFEYATVRIHFNTQVEDESVELSHETRHHLFMIVKEALNNILKYADAGNIHVVIDQKGTRLAIQISDDGTGFEVVRKFGNGLTNMKQRAADVNGHLEIHSEPGKGTEVVLSLEI